MPVSRTGKHLAVAVVAVSLPLLVAMIEALRSPWRPTGDYGLIALRTMDVPGHLPLDGVYSRFGFHHPGPLLFLLYAVPQRLLGPTGLLVAAALINLVAVIGIVVLLQRRGGATLLVLGTLGIVTLELAAAHQLADPWNPWVPMFPFALAILLAWSVWERDWRALPVLVLVAGGLVQAHLGYLAVVACLAVVAVAAVVASWVRRRDRPSCPPRVVAVAAALGLALWMLPVWDLFTGHPGNLRVIADHLLHSAEPSVGAATAARVMGRELGWFPPALGGRDPVQPFIGAIEGRSPLATLPFLLVLGGAVLVAGLRRDRPPMRLLLLVAGTLLVGWFSIASFEGDPYPYLVRWLWPLVVLGLVAAGWAYVRALVAWWVGRAAADGARVTTARRWAPALGLVLVAVLAVSAAAVAHRADLPNEAFSSSVRELAPPVADAVRDRGTVLLEHQTDTWGEEEAGLVAELWRTGVPLYVTDESGFDFGDARTIGDRPVDGVLVVAIGDERVARRSGALPEGSVLVASYDPLSPDERQDADALSQRAAVEFDASRTGAPVADPMTRAERARLDRYLARGRAADVYLDPAPRPAT